MGHISYSCDPHSTLPSTLDWPRGHLNLYFWNEEAMKLVVRIRLNLAVDTEPATKEVNLQVEVALLCPGAVSAMGRPIQCAILLLLMLMLMLLLLLLSQLPSLGDKSGLQSRNQTCCDDCIDMDFFAAPAVMLPSLANVIRCKLNVLGFRVLSSCSCCCRCCPPW
jgi:hypothetical protein